MKIQGMQPTGLPGCFTVWGERHEDQRGLVREVSAGCDEWKLTLITVNALHVMRGFHADKKRWRMLTCVSGAVRHIAMRGKQWVRHTLHPLGPSILWEPGVYSAYLSLENQATVLYHVSSAYVPGEQFTRRWDCLGKDIWEPLPISGIILSARDNLK